MTNSLRRIHISHGQYPRDLSSALQPGRAINDPDYALAQDPDAYETLLRDPETAHVCEYRRHLSAGRRWRVVPASDIERDKMAAAVVEHLLKHIKRFDLARFHLANCIFKGSAYAFIEGHRVPGAVAELAPQDWWRPCRLVDVDKLRFRQETDDEGNLHWLMWSRKRYQWELMGDRAKWFIRAIYNDEESTIRFGRGLVESIYGWQFFKGRILEDGISGVEKWANGIIHASIDALADGNTSRTSDDAATAWLDAIENMRSRHCLIHDSRDSIDVIQGPGQGHQMVTDFLAYLSSGIRVLVLGSNLPTSATEGGSYALASIQENSTEALVQFDRAIISEAISDDLVGTIWRQNRRQLAAVGLQNAEQPTFEIIDEQREDPAAAVGVISALVDRGIDLRADEVYDRTGFTPPGPADEVLKVTPPPAAAPFAAGPTREDAP